jgi:hypothetical protein
MLIGAQAFSTRAMTHAIEEEALLRLSHLPRKRHGRSA